MLIKIGLTIGVEYEVIVVTLHCRKTMSVRTAIGKLCILVSEKWRKNKKKKKSNKTDKV